LFHTATLYLQDGVTYSYNCIDSNDTAYFRWKAESNKGMLGVVETSNFGTGEAWANSSFAIEFTTMQFIESSSNGLDWAFVAPCESSGQANITVTFASKKFIYFKLLIGSLTPIHSH
jgi:hypothetical protein